MNRFSVKSKLEDEVVKLTVYEWIIKTFEIADKTLKTLAAGLVALGVFFIGKGEYQLGGTLMMIGWVLWVI